MEDDRRTGQERRTSGERRSAWRDATTQMWHDLFNDLTELELALRRKADLGGFEDENFAYLDCANQIMKLREKHNER